MKGKSSAEAKAELEKSGMSGAELQKILPHKVIIFVTFRASRRQREMYIGHGRLSAVPCRFPTLLHGPRYNLGNGRGAP